MDLCNWIIQNKCIENIELHSRTIHTVNINSKRYYIKKIVSTDEYQIHKDLELLSLPTFQKTLHLLKSGESLKKILKRYTETKELICICGGSSPKIHHYIISEEIDGKNFLDNLDTLSKSELDNILRIIFSSLFIAYHKIGFIHNDLHLGNILIQKISTPITISTGIAWDKKNSHLIFKCLDDVIVAEKYLPIIIDFDQSIAKNHTDEKISRSGTIPDDLLCKQSLIRHKTVLNDIWKLLGTLSLYARGENGKLVLDYIEYFIDRFEFQERKEEFLNEWFLRLPYS